jgi:hypothetical protein
MKSKGGNFNHAQADGVTAVERRIVQRYNRVTFGVGLFLAIVVPPLIYRWKRESMAVRLYQ